MKASISLDELNGVRMTRKAIRKRHAAPPLEAREWMTPRETALALGCSVATVHRLRRGFFAGVKPLPRVQFGRKYVFLKSSVARWQETNERIGVPA